MSDEIPLYRLTEDAFLAPNLIRAGATIRFAGTPGPHMEPLNEAAEAALAAYYKEHPHASLRPVEQLPIFAVEVVAPPPAEPEVVDLTLAEAGTAKAAPGPTEGGKVNAIKK